MRTPLVWIGAVLGLMFSGGVAPAWCLPPTPAPAALPAAVRERVEALLARADLAAYRGWLKYLRHQAETALRQTGPDGESARAAAARLDEWLGRIEADPTLLSHLNGVQEWAYESPVDGSGQPFKLAVPTDYDPARPAALSVYLHGYAGNHLEHSTGMAARPGWFDLAVLGRSRGGGYRGLSEADVLHAIAYVQAHWAVDPARIHLGGGSMGGGGTLRLGARYPHRWASGRPVCGYGGTLPVGNLLSLPIYATHSDDDYVVSVLHARGPLERLRELGGRALLDETTGLGHAAWEYQVGNARGDAWARAQVRPDSREVRRIDFTVLDGGAPRAWWAELTEWGPAPRPARFRLTAADQELHAGLENVGRLALRLDESPFDRDRPLRISINGAPWLEVGAPLPARIELTATADGAWHAGAPVDEPFVFRQHTPGGAMLLYQGEPLLIVYGTAGDAATTSALRRAAEAASRSPHPAWLPEGGDAGPDGVPHAHNLYGRLPVKADVDVTAGDLSRCHLVLLGSVRENALVARLAPGLPVQFEPGRVRCSDGTELVRPHLSVGLVHYNPEAPDRLLFWVASDDPATYGPGAAIPQVMSGLGIVGAAVGMDLLVMDATAPTLVAARSFDSRWRWNDGRADSPLLPARLAQHRQVTNALGEAVRQAAGADFALVSPTGLPELPAIEAGITRVADVTPLYFHEPIGILTLTGREVLELAGQFGDHLEARWVPLPDTAIDPERDYRVAAMSGAVWGFARVAQRAPRYRQTDCMVADAIERWLVPVTRTQP